MTAVGPGGDRRHLHLTAFIGVSGHHPAAWRHPGTELGFEVDPAYWVGLAQLAERGLFDALFIADGVGMSDERVEIVQRYPRLGGFEPLTLLSALAVSTSHIGLMATVSTSFSDPYNVARQFASLDHLSGGRAGWNVVTSQSDHAARNFGLDRLPPHDVRYQRAAEFVEVAKGLWDSWDDDAFDVRDKAAGITFAADGVHRLHHRGPHFAVEGPLNVPRPPQGHPVIVQAGVSEDGRELAARHAEVIYTPAQSLAQAQATYRDLHARMARHGRAPDEALLLPGIFPVVGSTEAEARRRYQELQDLVDPLVGLSFLSIFAGGYDLTGHDPDGPLPPLPPTNEGQGRMRMLVELAQREGLTLRQLYLRYAMVRGHHLVVGTAEQVADVLEGWFVSRGADGFNVVPPLLPGGLEDVVDQVVPELQRRGLFRTAYEGSTLRDRLGLARPASRWAAPEPVGAT